MAVTDYEKRDAVNDDLAALRAVCKWATIEALEELRHGLRNDFGAGGREDLMTRYRIVVIENEFEQRGLDRDTGRRLMVIAGKLPQRAGAS